MILYRTDWKKHKNLLAIKWAMVSKSVPQKAASGGRKSVLHVQLTLLQKQFKALKIIFVVGYFNAFPFPSSELGVVNRWSSTHPPMFTDVVE